MNWLERIVSKGLGKLGYSKSFLSPSALELAGESGRKLPDPSAHDYYPYMRAYSDKAWVYACVSVIVDAASNADFTLKDASGASIQEHPALDLLYRPNPFMSGRTLRQWITGSLELTGNAYVLKDARINGRPGELFPLLSHLVEIVPGRTPSRPVEGYRYRAGGKTAFYPAADVIHFKYFNPFDFYYGLSPLAAARHSADALQSAELYNRSFFDNSATISGVLSTDQRLDDATRTRILKAWGEKYRGEGKAHRFALLEGGLKWQATGMSQKDMDFIAGMKLSRETILAIFHVPPALVGLYEHAPQFNTKEQQRIFWQGCVAPKFCGLLETLTEFLLPDFDKSRKLYFEADFSKVSALREDETARYAAAEAYWRMGFTKEEVARALGLPFAQPASTSSRRDK